MRMSFFTKIKSFAKSNWTFGVLVVLPIVRFLWRAFVDKSGSGSGASSQNRLGDTYKRGDVIDVEVKK